MSHKATLESVIARLHQCSITRFTSTVHLVPGQEYTSNAVCMLFECEHNHRFEKSVTNILNKACRGCPACNKKQKRNTQTFENDLAQRNADHPTRPVSIVGDYVNTHSKAIFECGHGHVWRATPRKILQGAGCPTCAKHGYSQKAIVWLNSLGIVVQHAENGGEYRIPGTRWFVDGYDAVTNTVYEYHGDAFHGNPNRFPADYRCHPFNKHKTAGQLLKETINRTNNLRSMGYTVIERWETE